MQLKTQVAILAYLLHSLNKEATDNSYLDPKHDVWNAIGYWRNLMSLQIHFEGTDHEIEINKSKDDVYQFVFDDNQHECQLIYMDQNEVDFKIGKDTYFCHFFKS